MFLWVFHQCEQSACLRAGAAHRLSKCFVNVQQHEDRLVQRFISCLKRPVPGAAGAGGGHPLPNLGVGSRRVYGSPSTVPRLWVGLEGDGGCIDYASREGLSSEAACATLCPLWRRRKVGQEWEGAGGRDEEGRGRAVRSPWARASLGGASRGARRQRLRCKSILRSNIPLPPRERGSAAPRPPTPPAHRGAGAGGST